jgi:hypothetical protein
MGRPLNKKYFGNLNVGTASTSTDNGIGGEGLYSIANPSQLGNILVCSTATSVPALVIPPADIPTGIQATAQVVYEVASVVITNGVGGHNYQTATNATLTGLGGGVVIHIATINTSTGEVLTVDFASTGSNRGSFTTIPVLADTYQVVGQGVGNGDGNQQAHVYYRVKQINVTEKGSGYITAPAITWNTTGVKGVVPGSTTSVLTTDSGSRQPGTNHNVDTNQDNAIIIHAKTTSGGTVQIGDIQAQKTSRRYKVKTNDGVAVCKLVASNTPAFGEAYILATDHTGASYWVTKLTAHRATVIPRGDGTPDFPAIGTGYNSEVQAQHVGWTFGTAHATSGLAIGTVKIENA